MNKTIKLLLLLIIASIVGVLFYNKVYIPKTTYKTIQPTVGDLDVSVTGIGNVSAKNIYAITAQTGGKILAIHTDVGAWVKKGDLLLEMDGVDLKEQLDVSKASMEKAQYDIKAAKDELENLKAQKVLLEITYKRYKKLKEQKFASQSEYDKAKADLDSVDANINVSKSHIGSAKVAVKIALKNINVVKARIKRLKVYAPVDGYVVQKSAEVVQSVLSSTVVLEIVDVSTLWVETKLDERVSAGVRVGQNAKITLRSQENKTYVGVVKRIYATSDAVTLEREIDVAFVHPPKTFYINAQAEVSIALESYENVVKIPLNVIVQKDKKLGVWVVENFEAHFVSINKLAQNSDEVALNNFDKDSKIIVPDSKKKPLSNGMKIHL